MSATRLEWSPKYPYPQSNAKVIDRRQLDEIADAWAADGGIADTPIGIAQKSRSGVCELLKSVDN